MMIPAHACNVFTLYAGITFIVNACHYGQGIYILWEHVRIAFAY